MDPSYPILAAMAVSLALLQVNQRVASPLLAIANRWLRWLVFSFGMAYIITDFALVEKPYWTLVSVCFLGWFLLETIYNWLAISALSMSPIPLFPAYSNNPGGDEWPVQKGLLAARGWLRANKFKHLQALRAEVAAGIYLRVSIHEDAAATTRAQIMFMPQPTGSISMSCILTSLAEDGRRIVTDNLHIPFGGFYPEHWSVERLPWCRSLASLSKRHAARILGITLKPFSMIPGADIESSQRELDRFNTEMGFLHSYAEREEFGKITHAGRYRIWKEIWMLDYLGWAMRHG